MDKSEQYIKMCEGAKEIQRYWPGKPIDSIGMVFYDPGGAWASDDYSSMPQIHVINSYSSFWSDNFRIGNLIWLPRQDQLQEMVNVPLAEKIERFYFFCLQSTRTAEGVWMDLMRDGDPEKINNQSMEQLWLTFVMKENGKKWDGTQWVGGD